MSIPGDSVLEQTFVGGFGTFLTLYNYLITFRILLSWIPQAQGVGAFKPPNPLRVTTATPASSANPLLSLASLALSFAPRLARSCSAVLQPVFTVTDPFLNVFRNIVPSIGGLDLSPLLGFFLLNVLTQSTAAIGCELPAEGKGGKGGEGGGWGWRKGRFAK
jgi:uncharacterized protein YggT (Ycf19 family)